MSERLTATLADLRDKGITPNDLTPDELVCLVRACERVENPYAHLRADLCDHPVHVFGDVYLWPPTAGSTVWLMEFATPWWGAESWLGRWATVYALYHARTQDAFTNNKSEMRRRVLCLALRLCVHYRELLNAVNKCYGIEEHETPELPDRRKHPKAADDHVLNEFARIIAKLEVTSGIRKDEWLWGRSVAELARLYMALSELATAAFGGSKDKSNPELDAAIENLARVIAHITRRIRGERGEMP